MIDSIVSGRADESFFYRGWREEEEGKGKGEEGGAVGKMWLLREGPVDLEDACVRVEYELYRRESFRVCFGRLAVFATCRAGRGYGLAFSFLSEHYVIHDKVLNRRK